MYTTDKLLITVGEYTANPSDSIFKDLFLLLRTRHFYYRWKCEQLYGVQSQTTGAYDSHFWTKALPKLDRYRRRGAGDPLEGVDSESATRRILKTFRAYERYTFMSLVAHGITQILALELADRNYRSPL